MGRQVPTNTCHFHSILAQCAGLGSREPGTAEAGASRPNMSGLTLLCDWFPQGNTTAKDSTAKAENTLKTK